MPMKRATDPASWEAKMERRHEFTASFVAEHHPKMADAHTIEGVHSLIPLDGPAYLCDGAGNMRSDWWFTTNDSICALGFVWIAHLFKRHGLYDHTWGIGRSDQEPWAFVSEPYSHGTEANIEKLRRELDKIGVELIQYPIEQSTHCADVPGGTLPLVANVVNMDSLMGAVARHIVTACGPSESATATRKWRKRLSRGNEEPA